MQDRKKRIGVLVTLAVGAGLIGFGLRELHTSRRLAAEGRQVTAQVVNKSLEHRPKLRKAYYLEVTYHTDQGRVVTQRSRVSAERFARTNRGDTLPVRYLPDDPTVFALGAVVAPNYFHLLMGLLAFAIAGIYYFFGSSSRGRGASVSVSSAG